jgi:transcriptional regulator with XRE-family HTH domain
LPDREYTAASMRRLREKAGVSLRAVARRLGYSAAYVSDLELGRREWREKLIGDYVVAVDAEAQP